ncbi:methyltransferase [Actinoplanes sp. NPDC000266]
MVIPVRQRAGFVRTPDWLADQLCAWPHHDLRWLPAGARVLEPSAGDGALVAAILRANPGLRVSAVERDPVRAAACAERHRGHSGVTVHATTFERYAATAGREQVRFDAVVMNPPFAVAGQADVWLDHLRAAWHLLRPGGRLVAVIPNGFAYRSAGVQADARAFVEHHGTHVALPDDAFTESGVPVAGRVVRMTKPIGVVGTEYLLAPDRALRPVPMPALVLTGAAVLRLPAQSVSGGWHGGQRVVRYHGRCVLCGWLLWGFDDRQNDPGGPLSAFSAGLSLVAEEYEMHGPRVGLCLACANSSDSHGQALLRAYQHWQPVPALSA